MTADDARRLRELERENARLKRLVADKELEIDAPAGGGQGKLEPLCQEAVRGARSSASNWRYTTSVSRRFRQRSASRRLFPSLRLRRT